MKIEDAERAKRLIEEIREIEMEYSKLSPLNYFHATYDEEDIPMTSVQINGYRVMVPLEKVVDLVKAAFKYLDLKKAQLVKELENV